MHTSEPAFLKALELRADTYGLVLVPCDLARAAVGAMPTGEPVLFLPRAMGEGEQGRLVDDQISIIKQKRGAA